MVGLALSHYINESNDSVNFNLIRVLVVNNLALMSTPEDVNNRLPKISSHKKKIKNLLQDKFLNKIQAEKDENKANGTKLALDLSALMNQPTFIKNISNKKI